MDSIELVRAAVRVLRNKHTQEDLDMLIEAAPEQDEDTTSGLACHIIERELDKREDNSPYPSYSTRLQNKGQK